MSPKKMGNCRSKKDSCSGDGDPSQESQALQRHVRQHQLANKQEASPSKNQKPPAFDKEKIKGMLLAPAPAEASSTTPENDMIIEATRQEVNRLLELVNQFKGTTESDNEYKYLDEMLTRCILNLDGIKCNNQEDRTSRKGAIKEVEEAISSLERKLAINNDTKDLESGPGGQT